MTPAKRPIDAGPGGTDGRQMVGLALRGLFLMVLGLYMLFQPGLSLLA